MKIRVQHLVFLAVLLVASGSLFLAPSPVSAQSVETTPEDAPPPPAKAKPKPEPGPFAQGRVRVGFYGGAGNSYSQTYFILGGGLGYYVLDGLELGIDFEGWLGQDPNIWKLTPQLRYVVWQTHPIKPYVGAFWRQTYVDDPFNDYSSWGGRAGLAYRNGGNYLAVGLVYEKFNDCVGGDCDTTYPEVAFWISF